MIDMELWIARDENNSLWIYTNKPKRGDIGHFLVSEGSFIGELNRTFFTEITWENSPKKVRLELISDDNE